MLNKFDIIGFEKDYYWIDLVNGYSLQFLSDGTGVLLADNEDIQNVKWEYIENKNAIKIGYNGSIFYYIIKSKDKENFSAILKSKNKEVETTLVRTSKLTKPSIEKTKDIKFKTDEDGIPIIELYELDTIDKLVLFLFLLFVFIFTILILKLNMLTGNMSFGFILFLALISTGFSYIKMKNIALFFSKKYKDKLQDIFFKK